MRGLRLHLLWVVLLGCNGFNWEGTWEIGDGPHKSYLYSCMDSDNKWTAVLQDFNHATVFTFDGQLESSSNPIITGTCTLPSIPPTEEIHLTPGTGTFSENDVYLGSIINFVVTDQDGPFNLTISNTSDYVMFQSLDVVPGSIISWHTDLSLLDYFNPKWGSWVAVSWGNDSSNDTTFVLLRNFGDTLTVEHGDLDLYLSCSSLGTDYYSQAFHPTSGTKSTLCGDYSKLWIGAWKTHISPPLSNFGNSWYVCRSSSSGELVSSFASVDTVASFESSYFLSESVRVKPNYVSGDIVLNTDLTDTGSFYFQLSPNQTAFSGFVVYDNITYTIVGTLLSNANPYSYLCSPFDLFGGLWIEAQFSSWMNLCVNNNIVHGSYFGGVVTFSGYFYYSYDWMLYITTL
eukprot:TRINITY_DN4967_c0_g2_i3.p1 TRINITY_DN4967_c0_g2~~TRINITY_DN4967_c0_g2_i3.p1  ORF type:complete len:402 (-),score=54.01 TRINITY_DN4967_c0_g2_i3:342-1547(-)